MLVSGPTFVVSLLLAAAVGALAAWLLRGRRQHAAAERDAGAMRQQLAHRDTELLALRGRFGELEARAASLDAERQGANAEIVAMAKAHETNRAALSEARVDRAAWEARHATIAAELGSTAAALAALRSERMTAVDTQAALEASLAERTSRIATLEAELETMRSAAAALVGAPAESGKDVLALKEELAVAKRHLHEKASALTTAEVRIVDAFREFDRLRSIIAERTAERDARTADRDEASTRATILSEELAALRAAMAKRGVAEPS